MGGCAAQFSNETSWNQAVASGSKLKSSCTQCLPQTQAELPGYHLKQGMVCSARGAQSLPPQQFGSIKNTHFLSHCPCSSVSGCSEAQPAPVKQQDPYQSTEEMK